MLSSTIVIGFLKCWCDPLSHSWSTGRVDVLALCESTRSDVLQGIATFLAPRKHPDVSERLYLRIPDWLQLWLWY
jgi:hypothetical protein